MKIVISCESFHWHSTSWPTITCSDGQRTRLTMFLWPCNEECPQAPLPTMRLWCHSGIPHLQPIKEGISFPIMCLIFGSQPIQSKLSKWGHENKPVDEPVLAWCRAIDAYWGRFYFPIQYSLWPNSNAHCMLQYSVTPGLLIELELISLTLYP